MLRPNVSAVQATSTFLLPFSATSMARLITEARRNLQELFWKCRRSSCTGIPLSPVRCGPESDASNPGNSHLMDRLSTMRDKGSQKRQYLPVKMPFYGHNNKCGGGYFLGATLSSVALQLSDRTVNAQRKANTAIARSAVTLPE